MAVVAVVAAARGGAGSTLLAKERHAYRKRSSRCSRSSATAITTERSRFSVRRLRSEQRSHGLAGIGVTPCANTAVDPLPLPPPELWPSTTTGNDA